jgi:LPXTG-motif cell wall-anchored protein
MTPVASQTLPRTGRDGLLVLLGLAGVGAGAALRFGGKRR